MERMKKIKELLIALGVTPEIKGYFYLAAAIEEQLDMYTHNITRSLSFMRLYNSLAVLYADTPSRVERAMRWAIESALKKPSALLKSIFTFIPDEGAAKVSISGFVCTVAQYLYYEE